MSRWIGTSLWSALFLFDISFLYLSGTVFFVLGRVEIVLQSAKLPPVEPSDITLMLVCELMLICGRSTAIGLLAVSVFLLAYLVTMPMGLFIAQQAVSA